MGRRITRGLIKARVVSSNRGLALRLSPFYEQKHSQYGDWHLLPFVARPVPVFCPRRKTRGQAASASPQLHLILLLLLKWGQARRASPRLRFSAAPHN